MAKRESRDAVFQVMEGDDSEDIQIIIIIASALRGTEYTPAFDTLVALYMENRSYRVRMSVTKETSLWDTVYGCTEYPICPRCNSSLDREYQNYCDRCGQALDWHRKKRQPSSPKPDV